jgi:two-component system response regulator HydG
MNPTRVLVADDKENILRLFERMANDDIELTTVSDGQRAIALVLAGDYEVVVCDVRMPGADGFTILREIKRARPEIEVILMTAYASIPTAVEALKAGAYDYLAKPFDPDVALLTIQRAVERKRLREQAADLRSAMPPASQLNDLIGRSEPMQTVFNLIGRAASSDVTVLISGESGTGKELVARAIHTIGWRQHRRFVPVNCGAISEALVESEFFGHAKGAFTGAIADKRGLFEEADSGTLFLDEVGDLPLAMQVKLTRVLQERKIRRVGTTDERDVNVRVIAATNVNLDEAVRAGKFREDLYYRLHIFPILLPPLRDRPEDIPLLATCILEKLRSKHQAVPNRFSADAIEAMVRYAWPGNVRQLENVIERAVAIAGDGSGDGIGMGDLPDEVLRQYAHGEHAWGVDRITYREAVDLAVHRASREYLIALMRRCAGSVTVAARQAGMERESLHRLLKRYGMQSESFKPRNDSKPA